MLDKFVQCFKDHCIEHGDVEAQNKDLDIALKSFYKFVSVKKPHEFLVRLYNPCEEDAWECSHTVLEVVHNDCPFIVDSITERLTREGLKIYNILYPVVQVTRDDQGKLTSLHSHDYDGDAHPESIIHAYVSYIKNSQIPEIEALIRDILTNIDLAVTDWKTMIERARSLKEHIMYLPLSTPDQVEMQDFIQWLIDDNFTFLGCVDYTADTKPPFLKANSEPLGILRFKKTPPNIILSHHEKIAGFDPTSLEHSVEIDKISLISPVHRSVNLDMLTFRILDNDGTIVSETRFVGLFTSSVYYQSSTLIPIIRKKIDHVITNSGMRHLSHSRKSLIDILEGFPRDELLQIDREALASMCMDIFALMKRPRVKLFIRPSKSKQFMSCLVFVPRERFSARLGDKIQQTLQDALYGTVDNYYVQLTNSFLTRLHVIINVEGECDDNINIEGLESHLEMISRVWVDELLETLNLHMSEHEAEELFRKYQHAFPSAYQEIFNVDPAAYHDIVELENVEKTQDVTFRLYVTPDNDNVIHLKIFSPTPIMLSDMMPMLENMNLQAINSDTFSISLQNKNVLWIHYFRMITSEMQNFTSISKILDNGEKALTAIWNQQMQSDSFNKLILAAGMEWRQVVLIRALSKYFKQAGFTYSDDYVADVLTKHPMLSRYLIKLFNERFDPKHEKNRDKHVEDIKFTIEEGLGAVQSNIEDKIIRRFMELIFAILRTNYFQKDDKGHIKDYISFKFNSKLVPGLPKPYPHVEVFVHSSYVEGIHLRGGKVARGGLRWSDRQEDFRTEVLGLMKAQMAKNSVIVPVGSKGGFVVKKPPTDGSKEAFQEEGIRCYKTFLRGLLDITDNIVDGTIVPPKDVVRHDEDDPYLVVAADKGTATFSDIANSVSKNYGFWLDDAFASGGSAGYDHKKMGITARGAWISVERHFREMGINIATTDFTAVGIGDMSGDVFGNGMLLSQHTCLVGAFNHMHIFIDPNPDSTTSYAERKRLFDLPRSTWDDYNKELISKGGGVYDRKAKSIKLTPEAKERFGINEDNILPDDLIKAMLLSDTDLLWNGGIGTYIKASTETHEQVEDKSNDAIRVNGEELRFKVVGEGGNLGCTQRGRIEFAKQGGRINTDAIDNSAGVDCSDHEVNIKIALRKAIETGSLKQKDRNALLEEMQSEVARLVLRDNILQTQALTIEHLQGTDLLELQDRLIDLLHEEGILDPKIEFLPDKQEIARRLVAKEGLTRPELAVILAYTKLSIYDKLLNSNLPDDKYYNNDLHLYFPKQMHTTLKEAIHDHQLRREIIATYVTNSMVNRVGISFCHRMLQDTGLMGCDVARAYTVARDAFGLRNTWHMIESLDGTLSANTQVKLFLKIKSLIQQVTSWFLHKAPQPLDISEMMKLYAEGVQTLSENLESVLIGRTKDRLNKLYEDFIELEVPEDLARKIAGMEAMVSACDIVSVAETVNMPVIDVAHIYFKIGSRFEFAWAHSSLNNLDDSGYWQRLSLKTVNDDLYDLQARLTQQIIQSSQGAVDPIHDWIEQNSKLVQRYDDFIQNLKSYESLDFSMAVVITKRLQGLFTISAQK